MGVTSNVFGYPARVKKIVFDGVVSYTNVLRILAQCSTVEELVFTHETLGIDQLLTKPNIHFCVRSLYRLTHLNLQLLRHPSVENPLKLLGNIDVFLEASFPNLKSFKFYYSLWGNWVRLFLFLQRHVRTLTDIELQVGDRGDSRNTLSYLQRNHPNTLLSLIDLKVLREMKLKEFKFRDDVLHLNPTVRNIIFDILARQTGLEVFHFHSPGDMNVSILKTFVEANQETLKEVVVYNLYTSFVGNHINNNNNVVAVVPVEEDGEEDDDEEEDEDEDEEDPDFLVELPIQNPIAYQVLENPIHGGIQVQFLNYFPPNPNPPVNPQRIVLDMNMFSKCTNLVILALSCSPSNNPNQIDPVPIRMTQIHKIPPSIIRLHVTGFTFNRDEMVYLTDHLPNLKELLLSDTGKMRYAYVITSILKNCHSLEYVNITPVRIRGGTSGIWFDEIEELNILFQRFLKINYDPIDEMNGFEARITDEDREWIRNELPYLAKTSA